MMWRYSLVSLTLWVVNPELRRVYDLFFGFSKVEIFAILPLLSLVPHVWALTFGGRWRRLPPWIAVAVWFWLSAFSYGLLTAILSGNLIPGLYEFVTFIFPCVLGLWVATDDVPFTVAYKRITRIIFIFATVTSIYGIVQYVVVPPWDSNWLREVIKNGTTSFGQPLPFQIRVWSTLNDAGSFALFLAVALLLSLPELSLRKPLLVVCMGIWCVAFGLTLVRTGWLMFAFGTVAYLLFSPRRYNLLATFGVAAAVVAALVVALPVAVGNDAMLNILTTRLSTFQDLDDDISRQERQELYDATPLILGYAPFGTGLGILGGATRLGASGSTTDFDSGYLGRVLEMGLPGLAIYLIPQFVLLFASLRFWTQARRQKNVQFQAIAGVSIGMCVSFFFLQFAHDANGFPTLTYWLFTCLPLSAPTTNPEQSRPFVFA